MRRGISLIELVVTLALVAVVSLGVGAMIVQWNKATQRQTTVASLQLLRQNVLQLLNDGAAWDKTLADPLNTAFACVQALADCSAAGSPDPARTFSVRDRAGALFYDGKDPAAGFTANGSPCAGFPGPACPLRLRLTWHASCEEGKPCVAPLMMVQGSFQYDAGKRSLAVNAASHDFQLVKHVPGTAAGEGGEGLGAQMEVFCGLVKAHADDPSFDAFLGDQLTAAGHPEMVPLIGKLKQSCK